MFLYLFDWQQTKLDNGNIFDEKKCVRINYFQKNTGGKILGSDHSLSIINIRRSSQKPADYQI